MWRSGYLMCPRCGNAYYANMITPQLCETIQFQCPNYNCCGAELFTIDELMIPAVQKLNRLGYRTRFCCSGHNRQDRYNEHGYISFRTGFAPSSCPVGWSFDGKDVIRSSCDSLAWSIQNLEDWVETLAPRPEVLTGRMEV